MDLENIELIEKEVLGIVFEYGPRLLGALAVLVIGLWIIKFLNKGFRTVLEKREIEPSLQSFLKSLVSIGLKTMLIISIMGMIGIEMTSIIAVLASAGLAIGMALSGTLQNFAGGVILLILKPFKVGDVIEFQGYIGSVSDIQIFHTILKTGDNKVVFLPNGALSTSSLINYSREDSRRVEWVFGIAYGDKFEDAKTIILDLIKQDERILNEPEPLVFLKEMGDSSVNLMVRAWVPTADFWNVFFNLNEKVYKTFPEKGLSIPFPQMDIHLHKQD